MISRGGYTVIEVMTVLAVTSILFVTATTIFSGQQGRTQFSQTVQDLQSKIQGYGSAVAAGALPSGNSYSCSISSGRPVLDQSQTVSIGTNGNCILLGRAIRVNPGSNNIQIYTVIGDRDVYNGSTDTGALASSVTDASPTPAMDSAGKDVWLQNFTLSNATFVSSKINGGGTIYNLVGIYNSLESSGSVTALTGLAYPISSGSVADCIAGSCASTDLSQWNLCIKSASNQTALLNFNIAPGGLTANAKFVSCS